MEIGIVGLGRIGGGLARRARDKGIRVVGYTPEGAPPLLREAGMTEAGDMAGLAAALSAPRMIFLYIPSGTPIDDALNALIPHLDPGDIVIDGGNSYWRSSVARAAEMAGRDLHLVDLGTSGGVDGARNGPCFMAGGPAAVRDRVMPILSALGAEGGVAWCGGPGSGHYAKLVHNAVEWGIMQAIGEGVDLLERGELDVDVGAVLSAWRSGSVIRSWLVDLTADAYESEKGFAGVDPYIDDGGMGNWMVEDAMTFEIPVPVIAQAVIARIATRDRTQTPARAAAAMRKGFGAHSYGHLPDVEAQRLEGRARKPLTARKT